MAGTAALPTGSVAAPERAALLIDVGRALTSLLDIDELLPYVSRRSKELFEVESAAVLLLDPSGRELRFPYVDDADPATAARLRGVTVPRDRGVAGWVITHGQAVLVPDAAADPRFYAGVDEALGRSTREIACAPLRTRQGVLGVLEIINKRSGPLTARDLELLDALSGTVAVAIENARLFGELRAREAVLRREVTSLRRVVAEQHRFEGLVGTSPAMQEVLRLIESATDTPSNVLIEGETGTGKELVARAIHYNSARQARPFVAVNCAALNENLLESELFGHAKGAFTGALKDKKGLFEVAHEGTVFLDEIGDTSPALQAKLLRVLQEGELLPVGDTTPRRVNVRVVSATNRDLEREIGAGRLREDLYYRIATFPIRLPPLRERHGDIPLLVDHLLRRVAGRLEREIGGIEPGALSLLERYAWPGNVRELENELERAASLTPRGAPVGIAQLSQKVQGGRPVAPDQTEAEAALPLRTVLERFEREYVRRALANNEGNVSRTARVLGISRVALYNKLKALGLSR